MKSVLLWTFPLLTGARALEWKPYTSAGVRGGSSIEAAETVLEVPASHAPGGEHGPSLKLRMRKYDGSGGSPTRLVYLFVGGPAQDGALWEPMLPTLQTLFGPTKAAFIVLDHRGVGRDSSPTSSPEDLSWSGGDFVSWAASRPYPLTAINTSDAGRDAVLVARLLAAEHPNASHILVGSSYGTRVAVAAANEAPDQYSAILLDGLDMEDAPSGLGAVDGSEMLENCRDNAYCRRMTGDAPMQLADLIPQVAADMGANACRQELARLLSELVPGMSACAGIEAIFYKIMTMGGATASNRVMPAMLLVPLLQQLDTCDRPEVASRIMDKFRSLLGGVFTSLSVVGSDWSREDWQSGHGLCSPAFCPVPPSPLVASYAGPPNPVHAFAHFYISVSERWRGPPPSYCGTGCPAALFKICQAYNNYAQYRDLFGSLAYRPDGLSHRALTTSRARVLVLSGGLDFNTPAKAISAMFTMIQAPHKRLLALRNRGHELLSRAGCIRAAVAEMLGEGGAGAVEACSKRQNAVTMDWEGVDGEGRGGRYGIIMKDLFKEKPTPAEIAANKAVPDEQTSSGALMWTIIIVTIVAVVVLAATLVLFTGYGGTMLASLKGSPKAK